MSLLLPDFNFKFFSFTILKALSLNTNNLLMKKIEVRAEIGLKRICFKQAFLVLTASMIFDMSYLLV